MIQVMDSIQRVICMRTRRTFPQAVNHSAAPPRFLGKDAGATAIEYGLLVSVIAVVILASVATVGSRLSGIFASAACALSANGKDCGAAAVAAAPVPTLLAAGDWCPPSMTGSIIVQ